MASDKSKTRPPPAERKPQKKKPSKVRDSFHGKFSQEDGVFVGGYSTDDGEETLFVKTDFGVITLEYRPPDVRKLIKDRFQCLLDTLAFDCAILRLPAELYSQLAEVGAKHRHLYMDEKVQSLLDQSSESAYQNFLKKLPSRMKALPNLLVEQLMFTFLSVCGERGLFISKSYGRKAWRDLTRYYEQQLKKEFLNLRPGRVEITSRQSRASMLAFYNSVHPVCQSAKTTYKRNRSGNWRSVVKQSYSQLDSDDIENLVRLKPSEVALLMTGKRFNRISGEDLRGEDELKRQLGIARKEAAESTKN